MTVAGDIGSAPMVKVGAQAPLKRENPLKKQRKKMKTFRDLIKDENKVVESPVGLVGRTKDSEALTHIEDSNLAKEFRKIVKQLGGKSVARQLLAGMDNSGKEVKVYENKETIETYLRNSGYKLKNEIPTKTGKELEFYKVEQAEAAFEDLKSTEFSTEYNIYLSNATIKYS